MSSIFNFTPEQLTGKSKTHLVVMTGAYSSPQRLHSVALSAFLSLQQAALKAGFHLHPASSFRSFSRQQSIWNNKFNGLRKVHDNQGYALDLSLFDPWEKVQAILRWSALPGASRHHWGTELDIFDPTLLPPLQSLQLEPWEYQQGGYFYELSHWLQHHAGQYDFGFPFINPLNKKIGTEPWHISYLPLSELARQQFSADVLCFAWQNEYIEGLSTLTAHLGQIFDEYII